jgi:hypothetical protein
MILGRALETSDLQALLREGETGQPPAGRQKAVHLAVIKLAVCMYSIWSSTEAASSGPAK